MAGVRFTDVQARPTEFLDLTSITLQAVRDTTLNIACSVPLAVPSKTWHYSTRSGDCIIALQREHHHEQQYRACRPPRSHCHHHP